MESGSVTAKKRQRTSFRCRLTTENFLEIVCVSAEKEKSDSYPDCPHRTYWKGTSTATYNLMYSTVHAISWSKKGLCWARGEMAPRLPCLNTWPPVGGEAMLEEGSYWRRVPISFSVCIHFCDKHHDQKPSTSISQPTSERSRAGTRADATKSAAYWLVYLDLGCHGLFIAVKTVTKNLVPEIGVLW